MADRDGLPGSGLQAKRCQGTGDWAALPFDCLQQILLLLPLHDRVAATSACKAWRAVGERGTLWRHVEFATHRNGSRRSELRRLLSLAAWCQRHAGSTRSLTVSARVPPDCQPAALKAVAAAALAAAPSLRSLSLTTNRGFWPSFLGGLLQLRSLHLSSKEGGLSLTHDLTPLRHLASLVLEARQAVSLSDTVRLPPSVVSVELSCIRDWLPQPLSQLAGLRRLHVRRGLVSEGVLLTEYQALQHLTALTSLALEHQEEEAWLLPPEMLLLTRLRSLSFAGNDCSRWALHGSDEAFDGCLARMPHLTALDISACCMEQLMPALLRGAEGHGTAGSASDTEEQQERQSGQLARGPRLVRLLAHGNQLEAGEDEDGRLCFPSSLRQLSIDVQLLAHSSLRLPPGCCQLVLMGREKAAAMRALASALPTLLQQVPQLQHLVVEPPALEALEQLSSGGPEPALVQGPGGRWRPTRLPGQPRQRQQQGVLQQLRAAGVEVVELREPRQLPALLDRLAANGQHAS